MATKSTMIGGIGGLLCLLALTACGTSTPEATPTPLDLNPIRTEVAATMLAQFAETLTAAPSDTPLPSFTEPVTPSSTATVTPSPSAGTALTQTVGTPQPTLENRAQWVSQSIADGTAFSPGETFTMTWRLKNVGASTWTGGYILRYYSGETFGAPTEAPIGILVQPEDILEITVEMKAPTLPGNYRSDWVLSDETRSNFKDPIFLKITVVAAPTPTPTRTRAPTATP